MYNYQEIKNEVVEKRGEMQRVQNTTHHGTKDPTGKNALANVLPIKEVTIHVNSKGQRDNQALVMYPERIIEAVESTLNKSSDLMRSLVDAKYIYKRPWEQTILKENISKDMYYSTIKEFLYLLLLHLVEFKVFKISNKFA